MPATSSGVSLYSKRLSLPNETITCWCMHFSSRLRRAEHGRRDLRRSPRDVAAGIIGEFAATTRLG
jgi:hypothetical protein